MAEDKILRDCVHIAVGDDHTIGGKLRSKIYLDGVMLKPTVEIDNHMIVKKACFCLRSHEVFLRTWERRYSLRFK